MAREVIFEPHPVSPERKAELQAAGYRIIDARFAPTQAPEPYPVSKPEIEAPTADKPKKRGRPTKVAPDAQISDKADTPPEE